MVDKKTIDLSTLDTVKASNAGYELELLHPITKAPLGQFITVLGKDSDEFKRHNRETQNDRLRQNAKAARARKDLPVTTAEETEEEGTLLLVACTIGFRNIQFNGDYSFTPENAYKLYKAFPWIREQIDSAIVDTENFMKNLPKK